MDYRAEFTITLPEELLDVLGIDEDTMFESYFEDGKIKVRIIDEDFEDDYDDEEIYEDDEIPEECTECPHYCWRCGVCTLDE